MSQTHTTPTRTRIPSQHTPRKHESPVSSPAPVHRLLYRGALSLPDSDLQLDGLSFTMQVGDSLQNPGNLLNNPLALALESMRGRPSLHFLGTARLSEVWLDTAGGIAVSIHPYSVLSKIYFENTLCLAPITSPDGKTEFGVRVGLSDSKDAGMNDLMIYGHLRPLLSTSELDIPSHPSTSTSIPHTLQLCAARILPGPPPTRAPRPDDPTPRKPPPHIRFGGTKRTREPSGLAFELGAKRSRTNTMDTKSKGKGRSKTNEESDEAVKRAREVMLNMPKPGALGKDARIGRDKSVRTQDVFKVPAVPARPKGGDVLSVGDTDVFGVVNPRSNEIPKTEGQNGLEKDNKMIVKRAAVRSLVMHGVEKGHEEFNELYQMVYRGTSFSLRNQMNNTRVDALTVESVADLHARMYVCIDHGQGATCVHSSQLEGRDGHAG